MALIHSLKIPLSINPLPSYFWLFLFTPFSAPYLVILPASPDLLKWPVLRQVYYLRQAFHCGIIKEQIPVILISASWPQNVSLQKPKTSDTSRTVNNSSKVSGFDYGLMMKWAGKRCYLRPGCAGVNMMRYTLSPVWLSACITAAWMTLAGFNLPRVALFATRIFVWVSDVAFPSALTRKYLGEAAENLHHYKHDPSEFTFSTVYFAMLKKIMSWWSLFWCGWCWGMHPIKPPQRCYLCVVSDVLRAILQVSYSHNLLSDRDRVVIKRRSPVGWYLLNLNIDVIFLAGFTRRHLQHCSSYLPEAGSEYCPWPSFQNIR